jgi:hypothetical protein
MGDKAIKKHTRLRVSKSPLIHRSISTAKKDITALRTLISGGDVLNVETMNATFREWRVLNAPAIYLSIAPELLLR